MITCPRCGAQFDPASLRGLTEFQCAACHQLIELEVKVEVKPIAPLISPAAPTRARPAPRPPARPARKASGRKPPPPRERRRPQEARGRDRRPSRRQRDPKAPVVTGLLVGGVAVVIAIFAAMRLLGDSDVVDDVHGAVNPGDAGTTAPNEPEADPQTDPEAWKRLPAADRKRRVREMMDGIDLDQRGNVQWALDFLKARDEGEAAEKLAVRFIEKHPAEKWALKAVGRTDLKKLIDKCLEEECTRSYDMDVAPVLELTALLDEHAPGSNEWWADGAMSARVQSLLEQVREEEKRLADPYHFGVAKWVQYQRKIHVMRDFPSIHETTGPYVIFAQVEAKKGTALADVDPLKLRRAKTVLADQVQLFDLLYAHWMKEMGERFSFKAYGPENADHTTLLKANVFPDRKTFQGYNVAIRSPQTMFTRAYYSTEEPRFICTYVDEKGETGIPARQIQCHEAVHQLVHFYTWDYTRKTTGKEVHWDQCRVRPLWSTEGFAEFFSSVRVVGGEHQWMKPLDERMGEIWVFDEVLRRLRWKGWGINDLLSTGHLGDVLDFAKKHSKQKDDALTKAYGLYANLFYAKAWSLCYFLWYAEEGGAPKWRKAYENYLRSEFKVRLVDHEKRGKIGYVMQPKDFRTTMGLTDDRRFFAFAKEWREFEAALLEREHRPTWDTLRFRTLPVFGLDPRKK